MLMEVYRNYAVIMLSAEIPDENKGLFAFIYNRYVSGKQLTEQQSKDMERFSSSLKRPHPLKCSNCGNQWKLLPDTPNVCCPKCRYIFYIQGQPLRNPQLRKLVYDAHPSPARNKRKEKQRRDKYLNRF